VFGKEAKTRIWLVLDGDILYADKNGNGDLTEEGERIRPTPFRDIPISVPQQPPPTERDFGIGEVVERGGGSRNTVVKLTQSVYPALKMELYTVHVLIEGKYEQTAAIPFGGSPKTAPVAYFHGPLSMNFYGDFPTRFEAGATHNLSLAVGTQGRGTFAVIEYKPIPAGVYPVAEFEFPNKKPGGPPRKVRLRLAHRC
jgi:hypothetical protein